MTSRLGGSKRGRRSEIALVSAAVAVVAVLWALLGLATAARAQADAAGPITPAQVKVAGQVGEVFTRTLLLRLPTSAGDLRFVPQQLATASGEQTLPSTAVTAQLPPTAAAPPASAGGTISGELTTEAGAVAPGTGVITNVLPLTVTVDLRGAVAGSYTGDALLLYLAPPAPGEPPQQVERTIHLDVAVKQPWPLPALVLLLGLALGWAMTHYRTYLAPRDQVLARLGAVQHHLAADPELAAASPDAAGGEGSAGGRGQEFRAVAESAANAALAALREGDGERARTAAGQAERVIDLWQQQRPNWLAALGERNELLAKVPQDAGSVFLTGLRRGLGGAPEAQIAAFLAAQTPEPPDKYVQALLDEVDRLRGLWLAYAQLDTQVAAATLLVNAAADSDKNRRELTMISDELHAIDPAKDANAAARLKALADRVTALTANLKPKNAALEMARDDGGGSSVDRDLLTFLANWRQPTLAQLDSDRGPLLRLQLFGWVSLFVALLLLWLAGFYELYVQKTTFGATPLPDYLALLAFGFGAEATRASVTELVQGWGYMRKPAGG